MLNYVKLKCDEFDFKCPVMSIGYFCYAMTKKPQV